MFTQYLFYGLRHFTACFTAAHNINMLELPQVKRITFNLQMIVFHFHLILYQLLWFGGVNGSLKALKS
jgi:hypothetical protein